MMACIFRSLLSYAENSLLLSEHRLVLRGKMESGRKIKGV